MRSDITRCSPLCSGGNDSVICTVDQTALCTDSPLLGLLQMGKVLGRLRWTTNRHQKQSLAASDKLHIESLQMLKWNETLKRWKLQPTSLCSSLLFNSLRFCFCDFSVSREITSLHVYSGWVLFSAGVMKMQKKQLSHAEQVVITSP